MKKYYAVTTKMTFEKTVLVPVDEVPDIGTAIDLVDSRVETASIDLLSGDAEFETILSVCADKDGILELTDEDAQLYQIVKGE